MTALPKVAKPAERALSSIGVRSLEGVARCSEAQLQALHGMGPKAIDTLRAALAERGTSFRDGQ